MKTEHTSLEQLMYIICKKETSYSNSNTGERVIV